MAKDRKTQYRTDKSMLKLLAALLHDHAVANIAPDLPEDELEPEASMIISRLDEAASPGDLAQIIYDVFVEMFDTDIAGSAEDYLGLANEFWCSFFK